ncbi:MAG: DUF3575 domain-containing protein [Prevotella sp.]|nr:DUF3575 domain-containing protein [Prevotella sp.]
MSVRLHYRLVDGCNDCLARLTQTKDYVPAARVPIAEPTPTPPLLVAPEPEPEPEPAPEPRVLKKGGKAYVDFNVNSTDLDPTLHSNPRELQKIRASLDSLIADPTAVITRFTVTGFASPEGPYDNNERLASGRSQTLCQYIADQWGVPQDIISSSYVAEDWDGLRRYVAAQAWPSTPKMLRVIDQEADPDQRLTLLRKRFPQEYADIKRNALPRLRHSDYEIAYELIDSSEVRLSPFRLSGADYKAPVVAPRPTVIDTVPAVADDFLPTAPFTPVRPQPFDTYRALLTVKTNLLFDALLCPNVEVEMPLGRDRRWSVMGEVWFP